MINRYNYEMWFLDHSEGKLNDHDKELLSDFLDLNPDLKEEFESFEIFELDTSDLVFTGKTSLKKQINIENIEGLDEFEMLAIKKIEGNISENELDVLNHLTANSEVRKSELKAFEKTRLVPEKQVIYRYKNQLKKSGGIIRAFFNYSMSVAAIAVLVLFVYTLMKTDTPESNDSLAYNTSKNVEENNSGSKIISTDDSQIKYTPDQQKIQTDSKQLREAKDNDYSLEVVAYENIDPIQKRTFEFEQTKLQIEIKPVNSNYSGKRILSNPVINNYYIKSNTDLAENRSYVPVLTPKEFLIKSVKDKLDIKDNDYSRLNTMDVVSAAVDKSKIGSLNYAKNEADDSRELAFNIGSLSFSRKWSKE